VIPSFSMRTVRASAWLICIGYTYHNHPARAKELQASPLDGFFRDGVGLIHSHFKEQDRLYLRIVPASGTQMAGPLPRVRELEQPSGDGSRAGFAGRGNIR
jgi:hypothetical protein